MESSRETAGTARHGRDGGKESSVNEEIRSSGGVEREGGGEEYVNRDAVKNFNVAFVDRVNCFPLLLINLSTCNFRLTGGKGGRRRKGTEDFSAGGITREDEGK